MPKYIYKLWTLEGRVVSVEIDAKDQDTGAMEALPHFAALGEDLQSATSLEIIPADGHIIRVSPQHFLDLLKDEKD